MTVPLKTPTTIFSGFLGSGKTTIISHLLDELQAAGQQVVFIKNEIGDVDVDGKLLEGKHIQTKELLNGCICCTLVGPFIDAISEVVHTFQPDRIIIEASGAADPSAIALMVSSHPQLYRDGVISVIDVVNFEGYKDLSITAQRQAEFTDLIVFNKVELVDLDRKRAVVGYVRELNSFAPIVESPQGRLSAKLTFGIGQKELSQLLANEKLHEHADETGHSDHLAVDGLESFHCQLTEPVHKELLISFLHQLPPQVFRVKGFVWLNGEGVQLLNKVGKRVEFSELPSSINQSAELSDLAFIGFNIEHLQTELSHKLAICAS